MSGERNPLTADGVTLCPVCSDPLPLPSIEKILHGGRQRKYCNPRCKRLASRRQGLIAMLRRWHDRALVNGNVKLAGVLEQRIEHYLGRPFVRLGNQTGIENGGGNQ